MYADQELTELARRRAELCLRIGQQRQALVLHVQALRPPVQQAERVVGWCRTRLAFLPLATVIGGSLFARRRRAGGGLGKVLVRWAPTALAVFRLWLRARSVRARTPATVSYSATAGSTVPLRR